MLIVVPTELFIVTILSLTAWRAASMAIIKPILNDNIRTIEPVRSTLRNAFFAPRLTVLMKILSLRLLAVTIVSFPENVLSLARENAHRKLATAA
jgi:hypothetical protein